LYLNVFAVLKSNSFQSRDYAQMSLKELLRVMNKTERRAQFSVLC